MNTKNGLTMNSQIALPQIKHPLRIVSVLLILAAIGLTMFVFKNQIPKLESETNILETENTDLEARYIRLDELHKNKVFYEQETAAFADKAKDILSAFPVFMYLETKILYADEILKTDLKDFNLVQFVYGENNFVMSAQYETENGQMPMELYSVSFGGRYLDITYPQLKKLLDYGLSAPQRFVIKNITAAFNEETGYLSGDFVFDTYFISGQKDKAYEFPPAVLEGLEGSNRIDDLFASRTAAKPNPQPAPAN